MYQKPERRYAPKVACDAVAISRNTVNSWHHQGLLTWWSAGEAEPRKARGYTIDAIRGLQLTKLLRDRGAPATTIAPCVQAILDEVAKNAGSVKDFWWAALFDREISGFNFDTVDSDTRMLIGDALLLLRLNLARIFMIVDHRLAAFENIGMLNADDDEDINAAFVVQDSEPLFDTEKWKAS